MASRSDVRLRLCAPKSPRCATDGASHARMGLRCNLTLAHFFSSRSSIQFCAPAFRQHPVMSDRRSSLALDEFTKAEPSDFFERGAQIGQVKIVQSKRRVRSNRGKDSQVGAGHAAHNNIIRKKSQAFSIVMRQRSCVLPQPPDFPRLASSSRSSVRPHCWPDTALRRSPCS